jgi:hypothetical protein
MAVSDLISRHGRGVMIDDGDLSHGANHHHQVRALYGRLTGNAWRSADEQALRRLACDLPVERIEMAMLVARLRARRPIRSFAYFVPEILNRDYDAIKAPGYYLRSLWRKFEAIAKSGSEAR